MNPEPTIKHTYFSYTYMNLATPKNYWPNHKYKNDIATQIMTVPQVLRLEFDKKEKELTFLILEITQAAFGPNSKHVSDCYNEGSYIDILSYSFKPLKRTKCIQIGDSFVGTLAKVCNFQVGYNSGFTIGGNGQIELGLGKNNGFNSGSMIPQGLFTMQRNENCSSNAQEFEGKKFKKDEKNTVRYDMKLMYRDKTDKREAVHYNTEDLSSMRCCVKGARNGWSIVSFGIACAFLKDTVYYAPDAAKSSFAADWAMRYHIQNFQNLEFEWSTEVRTIFASNDWNTNKANNCGDYLNWITTVHKITHVLRVNIDDEGNPLIEVIGRNIKVLSATGYENVRIYRDLVLDENPNITLEKNKFYKGDFLLSQQQGLTPHTG